MSDNNKIDTSETSSVISNVSSGQMSFDSFTPSSTNNNNASISNSNIQYYTDSNVHRNIEMSMRQSITITNRDVLHYANLKTEDSNIFSMLNGCYANVKEKLKSIIHKKASYENNYIKVNLIFKIKFKIWKS